MTRRKKKFVKISVNLLKQLFDIENMKSNNIQEIESMNFDKYTF